MAQATKIFRLCIVAWALATGLGAVVDFVFPELVPEALRHGQEQLQTDELHFRDYLAIGLGLAILIIFVATAIGLYRFHAWAPRVALYVTFAGLFFYALADVEVYSPASAALSYASSVLWGAVLAMAFLPPVNARFRALPANSSMQPTGRERPAAD